MKDLSGLFGVVFLLAGLIALFAENFIVMGLLFIAGAILFSAATIADAIEKKK